MNDAERKRSDPHVPTDRCRASLQWCRSMSMSSDFRLPE